MSKPDAIDLTPINKFVEHLRDAGELPEKVRIIKLRITPEHEVDGIGFETGYRSRSELRNSRRAD